MYLITRKIYDKKLFIFIYFLLLTTLPVNAAKYYCPQGNGNYDHSTDIFDTQETCEQWNSDFWRKNDNDAYADCLRNNKIAKIKYQQGKCTLIQQRVHYLYGCKCTVEITPQYKKIHSYSCSGDSSCKSSHNAMEKLKQMYPN